MPEKGDENLGDFISPPEYLSPQNLHILPSLVFGNEFPSVEAISTESDYLVVNFIAIIAGDPVVGD